MSFERTRRFAVAVVAALCCAAIAGGCAAWRLPRIDPSGRQVLIWPDDPPPTLTGPPVLVPVAPTVPGAVPAPAVVSVGPGRVVAPPVYPDPHPVAVTPAPAAVVPWTPGVPPAIPATVPPALPPPPAMVAPPAVPAPAPITTPIPAVPPPLGLTPVVPAGPVSVATSLGSAAPVGADHLRVIPAGVLVPVGSEVVVKAGVLRGDGQPMSQQPIGWQLEPGGVGQFTDAAAREPAPPAGVWHAPRRIDDWNAQSTTTPSPVRLTRGTPDPADDVQVEVGEAWVSVTSLSEGTTHVTAHAPGIGSFNAARATIYWVDGVWILPPSAMVEAGRPHVLTTSVMRRTDGAPLAGWLVRYEVLAGGTLGYEGTNVIEAPTDANGQASVEVSPASPGGGTTSVCVTIIRPAMTLPQESPQFEVGRGVATITWTAAAVPPPATPAPVAPPVTPVPVPPPPITPMPPAPPPVTPTPIDPAPVDPYTPPTAEQPPGQPQLELDLRRVGPEQVGVGEFVRFDVTIANRGTDFARGIRLTARFDAGLRHPHAAPGEFAVEYPGIRDLAPGEAANVPLTFQVVDGGTQCHEVTVTAEGVEPVSARGCITGRRAGLEVNVTGPRSRTVGESAEFSTSVRNTGDVAATNVELVLRTDAELNPTEAEPGHELLPDGGIVLRVERLEVGERRSFRMQAQCVTPTTRACTRAIVTADGGVTAADEACVEILPAAG